MPHGKSASLTVATYNIHKGFSHFNRRIVVHDMRERLRMMGADIVFLQEVVGHNTKHVERHEAGPMHPSSMSFWRRRNGRPLPTLATQSTKTVTTATQSCRVSR